MSSTQVRSDTAIETARARRVDMKLEVVVIPVSDVERAKRFYGGLGWRLDADIVSGEEFRVVQFTPPGSPCSIHFGTGVTSAVDADGTTFTSSTELASALRRAEAAHGEHEKRTGQRDADWPNWYAEYIVREQAGKQLPS